MTENEAIEELKYDCNELGKAIPCDTSWGVAIESAYDMAIKALEEIQKYRAIGTVEECREARERQGEKKPIKIAPCKSVNYFKCSSCGEYLSIGKPFCKECGNAVDWSGEID